MSAVSESAPELLAPERLAEIRLAMKTGTVTSRGKMGRQLWGHLDAQATELATLRGQLAAAQKESGIWQGEATRSAIKLNKAEIENEQLTLDVKNHWEEVARLSALLREAQAAAAKNLELLDSAHWHGWVSRERLDMQGRQDINYPAGLDYEEKEDYAFQCWLAQNAPTPACPSTCTGCEPEQLNLAAQPFDAPAHVEPCSWAATCKSGDAAHCGPCPKSPAEEGDCCAAPRRATVHVGETRESEPDPHTLAPDFLPEPAAAGSLPSGGEAAPKPTSKDLVVGSCWRHKKKGHEVLISSRPGPFRLTYKKSGVFPGHRDFNRPIAKQNHYFLSEYEPVPAAPTTIEKKGGPGAAA